jgi:uncharacterized protein YgiM (DUF1202 family)
MNKKFHLCAILAATIASLAAALSSTTAVHTRPDEASPSITFLKAGTDPLPAPETIATTPAGWMAVEVAGPFEGYVQDRDLNKSLDMKPGAQIHLAPKADAGVLATALKDEKTNITGQRGRWIQVRLERKLTGYIFIGGTAGYLPPVASTPAGASAALSASPVAPVAYGTAEAGHAAPR